MIFIFSINYKRPLLNIYRKGLTLPSFVFTALHIRAPGGGLGFLEGAFAGGSKNVFLARFSNHIAKLINDLF